jgi:hypothetical protein
MPFASEGYFELLAIHGTRYLERLLFHLFFSLFNLWVCAAALLAASPARLSAIGVISVEFSAGITVVAINAVSTAYWRSANYISP